MVNILWLGIIMIGYFVEAPVIFSTEMLKASRIKMQKCLGTSLFYYK